MYYVVMENTRTIVKAEEHIRATLTSWNALFWCMVWHSLLG